MPHVMTAAKRDGSPPLHARRNRATPAASSGTRGQEPASERQCCRRCGKFDARIISRSEWFPVIYLRCDGCHQTFVTPA